MDSISMALITALDAGIVGSTAQDGQAGSIEAYRALKESLGRKFGRDSDLIAALELLEKKPDSFGRREVLKEEVEAVQAGLDPEITAQAQTLLDRVTARSGGEPLTPPQPVPLQRPARADHFVGHEAGLNQLLANLQPGRVVSLYGPAGIGKMALAAEALWTLAPAENPPAAFPDGIVYHNFYDQPRTDIALEQIARHFDEEPAPTPYDAAERALANRQALLVLGDVQQADDLPGVLAMRGSCGVLATSRFAQSGISEQQEVAPLGLDQAAALLRAWGKSRATDEAAVRRICELVGGLPLAVRLAGQYLVAQKEAAAGYVSWLETTLLPDLDWGQRQRKSLPLLLERSLARVSEAARQALAVCGLLALVPFDQDIVAETLTIEANQGLLAAVRKIFKQKSDETLPDFKQVLGELVRYGLLRQIGGRYQVSHGLIHAHARQHLATPAQATRRLAAIYVALAWEQSTLGSDGYAKLEINRPHFMKVLAACLQSEDWEAAYGLAAAVEDFLDRQGYWAERVIANEIGLITAWQLERPNEGAWLSNLGDTYRTMGHARWAIKHFEKALATAHASGDRHSQGNSLGNLGLAYRDLGQVEQARQYLAQALNIFQEIKSPSAKFVREWLAELEEEA